MGFVMRAKLLCLLTCVMAATTTGAASAQAMSDISGPNPSLQVPSRPVFAVIDHHLVSGELRPYKPLMALVDARQPTFSCTPSERGADIVLSCSDGSSAQVKLDKSGCGRSQSGEPVSMCIGVNPHNAVRRLSAPTGQTLRIDGERLIMEPVAGG